MIFHKIDLSSLVDKKGEIVYNKHSHPNKMPKISMCNVLNVHREKTLKRNYRYHPSGCNMHMWGKRDNRELYDK